MVALVHPHQCVHVTRSHVPVVAPALRLKVPVASRNVGIVLELSREWWQLLRSIYLCLMHSVHTAVFDLPMSKQNWKYISLHFSAPMQAGAGTSNEPILRFSLSPDAADATSASSGLSAFLLPSTRARAGQAVFRALCSRL
ncbi:unnamed protein product [Ixodes pacificus]